MPRGAWQHRVAAWWSAGIVVILLLPAGAPAADDTPRRPDLVVASLSDPPQRARSGDRFRVEEVTANRGRRRAAASETGFALVGRAWLAVRAVPPLRKRAASRGEAEIMVPASIPDGSYRLLACADVGGDVRERNERDNCSSSVGALEIDTVPPQAPSIDESPLPVTLGGEARFVFSSTEAGVSFVCALDGGPPTPCTSPAQYSWMRAPRA